MNENLDRAVTLLKAAKELLRKQERSYCVLNLLEETVFYDDAECDGNCLMKDIEDLLEEIECEADAIEELSASTDDDVNDRISRKMALEAIQRERDWLLSHGMIGAEHWLTHCGYNVIAELPAIDMNINRNRKSTAQTVALASGLPTMDEYIKRATL